MTLPPEPPQPEQPQAGQIPTGGFAHQPYPAQQPPLGQNPPPSHGGYPTAPPPKKRMNTGKILLIVGAGILALCCVGSVAFAALGSKSKTNPCAGHPPAANPTTGTGPPTTVAPPPAKTNPKIGQPAR